MGNGHGGAFYSNVIIVILGRHPCVEPGIHSSRQGFCTMRVLRNGSPVGFAAEDDTEKFALPRQQIPCNRPDLHFICTRINAHDTGITVETFNTVLLHVAIAAMNLNCLISNLDRGGR